MRYDLFFLLRIIQPYYELINWLLMYSNHIANRPQKRKKEENKIKEDLDEFRFEILNLSYQ